MNLLLLSSLPAVIPWSPIAIYSDGAGWSIPGKEEITGCIPQLLQVFSPRNWAQAVLLQNKQQSGVFFNHTTTGFQLIWYQPLKEQFPALQKFTLNVVPTNSVTEDVKSHKTEWQICSNFTESRIMLCFGFSPCSIENARSSSNIFIINSDVLNLELRCFVVLRN